MWWTVIQLSAARVAMRCDADRERPKISITLQAVSMKMAMQARYGNLTGEQIY
jgi:hypothetical protein